MASSSEFSIEDWKRHLPAASRQLHPREALALGKVVTAADQARRDQPAPGHRPLLGDVAASGGSGKLLRAKGGAADADHSPSRLFGHGKTGLAKAESQQMLLRQSQQVSYASQQGSPVAASLAPQQQQPLSDQHAQQQQQQQHSSPGLFFSSIPGSSGLHKR
ncbi:hypothetical protein COO60DRAFT_641608 [Scenedesmus sp. NREL 46B-D3]|nr:hypothetical protein COO60DRAFT_641608 [Scenedesmus sp. NREL 46B-D3]